MCCFLPQKLNILCDVPRNPAMYKLLARSTSDGEAFVRLIHPDYITHDMHTWPTISTHHLVQHDVHYSVIVTPADLHDYLIGRRNRLIKCCSERDLVFMNIRFRAVDCYSKCKQASYNDYTWSVITGADDLIYKLCKAINVELFFCP
jgi:hypothetical protein